jgi:hypothetical protein
MTKLVGMALRTAAELPDAEQDRIAQLVLDEIDADSDASLPRVPS